MQIYLNIPFCKQQCSYCCWTNRFDPNHRFKKTRYQPYVAALRKQISSYASRYGNRQVDTIFFGGGTPTVLSAGDLGLLLSDIYKYYEIRSGAVVTTECSPGTIDKEKIVQLQASGFNRISMGVESFDRSTLIDMRRKDDPEMIWGAIDAFHSASFSNFNIDLMFGLPDESWQQWVESIKQALRASPAHMSIYPYYPAENTSLYSELLDGKRTLVSSSYLFEAYEFAKDMLHSQGYDEYLYSLFCRSDQRAPYDENTFNMSRDTLGFGAGACSNLDGQRYIATHDVETFAADPSFVTEAKQPDDPNLWLFPLLKMLRTDDGINYERFQARSGITFETVINHSPLLVRLTDELTGSPDCIFDIHGIRFTSSSARARFFAKLPFRLWESIYTKGTSLVKDVMVQIPKRPRSQDRQHALSSVDN